MDPACPTSVPLRGKPAFTLIEMIGAMTIIAIALTALAPPIMDRLKRGFRESEALKLDAIRDAVRRHVVQAGEIPGPSNFVVLLAPDLGWATNQVLQSQIGPRLVIFDDAFRVGTNGGSRPPFNQGPLGSIAPVNARLLLLSSLAAPLPSGLSNGFLDAASFSNLWNTPPDTIPSGWTWSGVPQDLEIRRIQLSDLFLQLVLNNSGTTTGRYSFNGAFTNVLSSGLLDTYLVAGTRVGLHGTNGAVQALEVIDEPLSRAFAYNAWRSTSPGAAPGWFLNSHVRGCDLQAAFDTFVESPLNPRSSTTPSDLANGYVVLMQKYLDYVASGWSIPAKNALSTAQGDVKAMMNDLAQ